jgi:aldehyde:ferredoxin oxidoreductase
MSQDLTGGYNGKILRVDLSRKIIKEEPLDGLVCRRYLGGSGFIAYYLWKELKKGVDALSPDNRLVFALGPVSGLNLPGAARHCVGAKSPMTGGIAKAEVGGFWAAECKRADYDAIIIEGKADKPVYLWVQDGEASLRDAGQLWGMETKDLEAAVRAELGDDKVQLAMIGPAGENMVRYACIMHGCHDAAGRGGLGAVMGSKNLKAVAVRGHHLPETANPERIKEIRQLKNKPSPFSKNGTGGAEMMMGEKAGNLPVRNFRDGLFPRVEKITALEMQAHPMWVSMDGCYACPVRCKKIVRMEKPYNVDVAYGGPEYESIAALGSDCGVGDIEQIVKANERCGAYSLDTISTGSTIAFAIECYEKGLLTKQDTGGLELRFGDGDLVLKLIDLISTRQGIGALLAEGTARMAKKLGGDSRDFAIQVKGLEAGMHDPRTKAGIGLGYMVTPAGADHCCNIMDGFFAQAPQLKQFHPMGVTDPVDVMDIGPHKVDVFKLALCKAIIDDSMVLCAFTGYDYQLSADALAAATGWTTGPAELMKIGERILTLFRLINLREGITAADDVLPKRFFQPKTDGALADKSKVLDPAAFAKARQFYYALMGWDSNGVPLPEKVESLYID